MNTSVLYGKMIVTIIISLFTVRIVLNALGSSDFGTYNLVAGVIAILSFLNTAMTVSTQRYLSFYQGKDDLELQKKIFGNSLFLHISIGICLLLTMQIIGLLLFEEVLNIESNRIFAAKVVYQCMCVAVFLNILSVPFIASINAHEQMHWIAIVDIVEVMLKFIVALMLMWDIIDFDKLIFYGSTTMAISLIALVLYMIISLSLYNECSLRIKGYIDRMTLAKMSSFAGWNLFGSLCAVGRLQGVAVVLNVFKGTTINAAYAISNQVSGQMYSFSGMMMRAVNPQIMKSEGAGDRKQTLRLSMTSCKFGFFLLSFFAIPCLFEINTVLYIWLKNIPDYAISFCSLTLITTIINQLTVGLPSAIQATGRIKGYQSIVGSILLLNVPLAYILLAVGLDPIFVLVGMMFVEIVAALFRIYFAKKNVGLSIYGYYSLVLKKITIPVIINISCCLLVVSSTTVEYRILITVLFSAMVYGISIFLFGLDKEEKIFLLSLIQKILRKRKM
ncbi:hypothetical protein [Dysgonomonas sp. Marseille-P4361]|uniref:hypothetical protein n=1 Tax=Dysgonomonas sp. Marseille-P4361 TaxID=2161820 RepID=UPI002101609E|nr:hypothetical protein [Dysgonomonas sp. Marseille-P4361]